LVIASSAAVYGADHIGPISEGAALTPMSPYGQHKLMMEQLCRSYARTYGIRSLVVRFFSVYGPHLRKQLLWDICSRLISEPRSLNLGGTGAEVRDWTDVRDVVRLLAKAENLLSMQNFRVVNGGSGKGTSVAAVAHRLVTLWGCSTTVQYSGVARPGDPTSLLADDGRLREIDFRWQIPLDQGLADYVEWFKELARG
jgi:UDP-glucose 4-epimerase